MIGFIKKFIKVYTTDYEKSYDDKGKHKFKEYHLSDIRLNKILSYTKNYAEEDYNEIEITVNLYKKYKNKYLNGYLNSIYYHYENYEKKTLEY